MCHVVGKSWLLTTLIMWPPIIMIAWWLRCFNRMPSMTCVWLVQRYEKPLPIRLIRLHLSTLMHTTDASISEGLWKEHTCEEDGLTNRLSCWAHTTLPGYDITRSTAAEDHVGQWRHCLATFSSHRGGVEWSHSCPRWTTSYKWRHAQRARQVGFKVTPLEPIAR